MEGAEMSKLSEAFSPQVFAAASFVLSSISLFISSVVSGTQKKEQEYMECWDCVFSKTVDAKECFCKVTSCLPYLSTVNGKPIQHPAWGCQYFIRKHAGNRNLVFDVKLKDGSE